MKGCPEIAPFDSASQLMGLTTNRYNGCGYRSSVGYRMSSGIVDQPLAYIKA